MYDKFETWLTCVLGKNMPLPGVAIIFNLYEYSDNHWAMQVISADCFEIDDPDWCCDEAFSSGEDMFIWKQDCNWENILENSITMIKKYLSCGKYAFELNRYEGIAVGFVDGDITVLYCK